MLKVTYRAFFFSNIKSHSNCPVKIIYLMGIIFLSPTYWYDTGNHTHVQINLIHLLLHANIGYQC